jgi:hypothetical protein
MAGQRGPGVAAKAAAFDQLGMQVTPANVLGVYGVIMEEMTRLQSSVQMFRASHFVGMPSLGSDPVSLPAAQGFSEATNHLLIKCQADIADLRRVSAGLAAAARAYGKTEEQVKAAFDPGRFHYQPSPVRPPVYDQAPSLQPLVDGRPVQPVVESPDDLLLGGGR